MKRLIAVLSFLLASGSLACFAGSPKLSLGVEWGYSVSFHNIRHFNYLDAEGSRIDVNDRFFKAGSNAGILASIGVNIAEKCNLSLCSGYLGVEDNIRIVPLLARFTVVPSGVHKGGFILTLDGGAGIDVLNTGRILPLADFGTGYRVGFDSGICLDFKFMLRGVYDNPSIFDPTFDDGYVPASNIKTNQAVYLSAGLSAALCF